MSLPLQDAHSLFSLVLIPLWTRRDLSQSSGSPWGHVGSLDRAGGVYVQSLRSVGSHNYQQESNLSTTQFLIHDRGTITELILELLHR